MGKELRSKCSDKLDASRAAKGPCNDGVVKRHRAWGPLLLVALVVGCGDPAVVAEADAGEPPLALLPALELSAENAVAVASSIWADRAQFEADDLLGVAGPLFGATMQVAAYAAPGVQVEVGCAISGTSFVVGSIADPATPGKTAGDSLDVTYLDCDSGDGGFLTQLDSGTVFLLVDEVTGDDVRSTITIDMTSTIDGFGVFSSRGIEKLAVATLGATTTLTLSTERFEVDFNNGVFIAKDLSVTLIDGGEEEDAPYELEFSSTTSNPRLNGSYTVETSTSFKGPSNAEPVDGVMLVTGAGGAQIRLSALDTGMASIEFDADGDGTFEPEAAVVMPWIEFERTE